MPNTLHKKFWISLTHAQHIGIKDERRKHAALENKANERVRVGNMCVPRTKGNWAARERGSECLAERRTERKWVGLENERGKDRGNECWALKKDGMVLGRGICWYLISAIDRY